MSWIRQSLEKRISLLIIYPYFVPFDQLTFSSVIGIEPTAFQESVAVRSAHLLLTLYPRIFGKSQHFDHFQHSTMGDRKRVLRTKQVLGAILEVPREEDTCKTLECKHQ